jgi:aminomethyltransferase
MSSSTELLRTPLNEIHRQLNAKMVPFGGWEMPVQYAGIMAEYEATRQQVTVFDTSHMGEFLIDGDARKNGFDQLVTQPIDDMPVKTCRYGALLNEQGGVMDDLIVYRLAVDRWMVVVNGATMEKDAKQFQQHLTREANFRNISFQTGKLDVQGPASRKVFSSLVEDLEKLDYYTFDYFNVLGENVIVSRTGYTGELGYEIYFPWDRVSQVWQWLLDAGVKPAGLGVRDVLRIEMGYCLYGHELSEQIDPLTAGLSRFIDWQKDFIGKAALEKIKKEGPEQKLACFVSDSRRSLREGHQIFSPQNDLVGRVTSGSFSPSLTRGIGLGFVDKNFGGPESPVLVGEEGRFFPARISRRPIYQNGSLKA